MERVLWVTLRDKGPSSWSMWFPELFMEKMVLKLCILLGVPFLPLQPSLAQSPWPITQRGHNFPLYHSLWLFSSPLIFLSYNQRLGFFFFERSIPLSLSPSWGSFTLPCLSRRALTDEAGPSFCTPKAAKLYSVFFVPEEKQFASRQPWQEPRQLLCQLC